MSTKKQISIGATVLLVIIASIAAWFAFLSDSEPDDEFALELLAADPVRFERTVLSKLKCPDGRGESPLADVEHELGVPSVRSGYASGQVAAFTLSITADATLDPLELSIEHGKGLNRGLDCVFVDPSDRAAVERNGGTDATAQWVDDATLKITGLEAGETAIVEIWGVVTADHAEPQLPLLLAASGASAEVLANQTVINFTSTLQGTGDVPEMNLAIDGPSKPIKAGSRVTHTVTLTNESLSAPASFAVMTGTIDNEGVIDSVKVFDDEGTRSKCEVDPTAYTCDLGFVNPEESIVLKVVLGADQASLNDSSPRRVTSDCSTPLPHVCHEVEFTQSGSFSPARADDEKSVVITTEQVFLASVEHDPPTAYVGTSIELSLILAVSDGESRIDELKVGLDVCDGGDLRYISGDSDGNFILSPDERWEYACRADDLSGATAVATINATDGPKSINEFLTVTLDVINPHMSTMNIPVVTGSAWDLINDGDQPITNLLIESTIEGCDVTVDAGDELTLGVLDVDEVWNLRCEVANADLAVFGKDPLGGSLSDNERLPGG